MSQIADRLLLSRQRIMRSAFERFIARSPTREPGLRRIAKEGPGAADSSKRRAEYMHREQTRAALGIANEGTRVSFITAELQRTSLPDPAQQGMLKELLSNTADPLADVGPEGVSVFVNNASPARPKGVPMSQSVINISGGIHTSIAAPA